MIVGDSADWRRQLLDVHEVLLGRIAVVWPQCSSRFGPKARENPISDQLVLSLQKDRIARRYIIVSQYKLLDEDLQGDVVTKGFVDIAVLIHQNELYLAFECKRLNIRRGDKRESLAGKYVNEGVMRYVSAQYARRLPLGAMLGYVMDGDTEWAMARLSVALEQRSATLRLAEPPIDLASVAFIHRFETLHYRAGEPSFEVRHGLLPLSQTAGVGGAGSPGSGRRDSAVQRAGRAPP
jgi:hypothetical protein